MEQPKGNAICGLQNYLLLLPPAISPRKLEFLPVNELKCHTEVADRQFRKLPEGNRRLLWCTDVALSAGDTTPAATIVFDAAAAAEAVRRTLEVHPSRRLGEEALEPETRANEVVVMVLREVSMGADRIAAAAAAAALDLCSSSTRRRVRSRPSLRSLEATRRGVSPAWLKILRSVFSC